MEDPTADEPTPVEPAPVSATEPAPVRVYRSSTVASPRRRKIAYGWVAGTAALALAIAVVALTVPELIAGNSMGNSGRTTFFSKPKKSNDSNEATTPATEGEDQETDTSRAGDDRGAGHHGDRDRDGSRADDPGACTQHDGDHDGPVDDAALAHRRRRAA